VITPGCGTRAVAEGVLAHTLALVKRVAPLTELVCAGRWSEREAGGPIGDLDGATIGIIGHGRIGRRVGELAAAFGMRVLAYDPYAPPPAGVACGSLDELVAASDVLTLHVPLTPENHHLVDAALLTRTKPGAVLINCGRGALLDLDAALAALESGQLSGVGLDVFESEPPVHHPIFNHPSVSLTPHLMGLTRKATAATFADAARGVVDVLNGRQPAAVANPGWTAASTTISADRLRPVLRCAG
jgi:phosphoglycerate dehydrogenase-like enzyme